jgi:hypothetical protein
VALLSLRRFAGATSLFLGDFIVQISQRPQAQYSMACNGESQVEAVGVEAVGVEAVVRVVDVGLAWIRDARLEGEGSNK